jgi:hypothetical protein
MWTRFLCLWPECTTEGTLREGRIGGSMLAPLLSLIPQRLLPYPACEMSSHCPPLSVGTTGRPPPEFHFDLGIEQHVVPEPEKRVVDNSSDAADNPTDTAEDPVEDPATSRKKGSFYSDKKVKFYTLEWPSLAEFDAWCAAEEKGNSIEFWRSTVWMGGALWTTQRLESKKIGCPCHILIKIYPHTSTILG